jgi:hypothetical protein
MRTAVSTLAIVLVASFIRIDSISYSPLAPASARAYAGELRRGLAGAAFGSEGGQDRVAGVLSAARQALGGEDKIAAIKTLEAEGPFRRSMGGRVMEGVVTVTIARPDKMKRVEDMQMGGMVGGPSIERTAVLAGATSWEDSQNRGGMGGGMRIQIATAGPGGPSGPGGAAPTQAQLDEARTRRMRVEFHRLMAALIADAGTPWVDAGIAESPDGKADILETKEETGRTLRLFIDQATKLPLMVQYQDPKPRVMIAGGPGGPGGPGRGRGPGGPGPGGPPPMTPEQMKERMAEMQRTPPEMGTYAMHLSDYRKVDGVMLPHKIETSLDGEPNQEWTIEKYKVNPNVKAETWEKK